MIKITVLLSTYNGQKYLPDQIESIINQKGDFDLKLLVRDDGSTDSTKEIIDSYRLKYPKVITFIEGNNIGCNGSFFHLIENAPESDYYAFSDQDDVWFKDKLSNAIFALEKYDKNSPLLYSCRSYMVYDDLKPFAETRDKLRDISMYNSLIQNICPGHNEVFNHSLVTLLKDVDYTKLYYYDSWVMNVANLFGNVVFDNSSHTYYRQHKKQKMGYEKGLFGRLLLGKKRIKSGDGCKISKQIEYFCNRYHEEMCYRGYYEEYHRFLKAHSFFTRLSYMFKCKLYRQSRLETIAFKIAYILGYFNYRD